MKKTTLAFLLVSHLVVGAGGFALGIYMLPILIAPPAPTESEVKAASANAMFSGEFRRDLQDSDALHWGEGTVSIGATAVSLMGRLAPGPDYKLYFSPQYLETEAEFNQLKSQMLQVADIKTFENFVVDMPAGFDPTLYNTVIVWCETFGEFITSAQYR